MKNLLVIQSGGPTAVINSSLAGVIKGGFDHSDKIGKVYGGLYGIEGVEEGRIVSLEKFKEDGMIELLKQTPSSYLGSCRKKLPKLEEDRGFYERVFEVFKKYDIGYFFCIGGNDSMDTVDKLNDYAVLHNIDVKIMGVPKTIDNDLPVTDHTPGFGSAAKYIAATVREIAVDAFVYDLKSVLIVEIMGRNAGWLTAASALSRTDKNPAPHLIYLPENVFDLDEFVEDVKKKVSEYGNIVVCVSEGIHFKDGTYVCETTSSGLTDVFNHKCLSGTAKYLESVVREKLGYKARAVELNVCQRSASHIASYVDLAESQTIGAASVLFALKGKSGEMMVFDRISNNPYEINISSVDIKKTANLEKCVPVEWTTKNDVLKPLLDYLNPLIQGEPEVIYENGLPVHIMR